MFHNDPPTVYVFCGSPQFGHLFLPAPPEVHLKSLCIGPMAGRADWTAAALLSRAAADDRPPRMAVFTQPPCLPAAAGRYLLRRETAVKGRMPLRCDHRLLGLQIIKSRQDLAVGAVRAIAFPVHTVGDDRTERMSSVTEPPHAAIGICAHRLRRQRTVLFPIPLFSKLRMQRSEIIESGQDLLSRAERTACV